MNVAYHCHECEYECMVSIKGDSPEPKVCIYGKRERYDGVIEPKWHKVKSSCMACAYGHTLGGEYSFIGKPIVVCDLYDDMKKEYGEAYMAEMLCRNACERYKDKSQADGIRYI